MKSLYVCVALGAFGVGSFGCASARPPELVHARTAFDRAQASQAPQLAPAELQSAAETLAKAEATFDEHGDEPFTRDLAYVAQRRAEFAIVHADVLAAERAKEQAERDLLATATSTAENRTQELRAREQMLEKTTEQLAAEKKAREDAEKRVKEAMARLSAIAQIKDEPRGLVITLPGGVLFESGKSALLSTAQERLNQVADALLQNRDGTMVVEGHTDSQGDDASNQKLSEDRAKAVRDYLVSRGVAADRISALGQGEAKPVADNKTPEGRANNRRVEIVVNGGKDRTATPPGPAGTK